MSKISQKIYSMEEDIRMLKILKEDLLKKFKDSNLKKLNFKIEDLENKITKKKNMIEKFEWFFQNYIQKISLQINEKKKKIAKNKHILENHPDILHDLVFDIIEKERDFKKTLLNLQNVILSN